MILKVIFANSVDPDQTAPLGAVLSRSTLFVCMQKWAEKFARIYSADDIQMKFSDASFLGILRVEENLPSISRALNMSEYLE